jgi:hypothetical protein
MDLNYFIYVVLPLVVIVVPGHDAYISALRRNFPRRICRMYESSEVISGTQSSQNPFGSTFNRYISMYSIAFSDFKITVSRPVTMEIFCV